MKKFIILFFVILFSGSTVAANFTANNTVFITGANRGIGLGLVNEYVDMGWNVIATARKPDQADELQALAKDYKNLAIEQLDVTDFEGIDALAAKYEHQPIDVLINNAGVKPIPSDNLGVAEFDFDTARLMFDVNVLGPIKVSKAFLPNVAVSSEKKIVNISSIVASFDRVPAMPRMYSYRSSKAMLNAYMFGIGADLKQQGITAFNIHPGAVNVDPSQQDNPNEGRQGPMRWINVKESASKMVKVIEKTGIDMNGLMVNYEKGEVIPF